MPAPAPGSVSEKNPSSASSTTGDADTSPNGAYRVHHAANLPHPVGLASHHQHQHHVQHHVRHGTCHNQNHNSIHHHHPSHHHVVHHSMHPSTSSSSGVSISYAMKSINGHGPQHPVGAHYDYVADPLPFDYNEYQFEGYKAPLPPHHHPHGSSVAQNNNTRDVMKPPSSSTRRVMAVKNERGDNYGAKHLDSSARLSSSSVVGYPRQARSIHNMYNHHDQEYGNSVSSVASGTAASQVTYQPPPATTSSLMGGIVSPSSPYHNSSSFTASPSSLSDAHPTYIGQSQSQSYPSIYSSRPGTHTLTTSKAIGIGSALPPTAPMFNPSAGPEPTYVMPSISRKTGMISTQYMPAMSQHHMLQQQQQQAYYTKPAKQLVSIELTTKLLPKYYRNGRRNLQCFPNCTHYGDYSKITMENFKQHDFLWGKCRGALELAVELHATAFGFEDIVVVARIHSIEDSLASDFEAATRKESYLDRVISNEQMIQIRQKWILATMENAPSNKAGQAKFHIKPKVWKYDEDMQRGKYKLRNSRYYIQIEAFVPCYDNQTDGFMCVGSEKSTPFEVGSSRVLARQKRKAADLDKAKDKSVGTIRNSTPSLGDGRSSSPLTSSHTGTVATEISEERNSISPPLKRSAIRKVREERYEPGLEAKEDIKPSNVFRLPHYSNEPYLNLNRTTNFPNDRSHDPRSHLT